MFNKRNCNCGFEPYNGMQGMNPIVEPTITTCSQKDFCCEVPQE